MMGKKKKKKRKINDQLFQARLKANDLLQGFLKQLLALSGATVLLSITFVSDIFGTNPHLSWNELLFISWGLLGLSVVAGVIGIGLLVNNLDVPNAEIGRSGNPKMYAAGTDGRIVVASVVSMAGFFAGIVLLAIFAALNMSTERQEHEDVALQDSVLQIEQKLDQIISDMERPEVGEEE